MKGNVASVRVGAEGLSKYLEQVGVAIRRERRGWSQALRGVWGVSSTSHQDTKTYVGTCNRLVARQLMKKWTW